jgi:beta-glucanase (GH16 family)
VIAAVNDSLKIGEKIFPVTSASINTKNKGDWKYGRIEVRAKLPSCLGSWPAIWMMSTKSTFGSWPRSGEIDIMEHVGYDPDKVHFNVHTEKYNHTKNTGRGIGINHPNTDKEFNIYAIEWFEDRIDWYLNEKKVFTVENNEKTHEAWPFDYEFYLIINFAFGGSWGAVKGVDFNALPQYYYIDYVRIYQ